MEHPFGIWSLVPPVLAIGLAMATRRVVVSLLCGVIAAGLIVSRGDLGAATFFVFETALWTELTSNDHLRVFAFTLLMGAMVGVVQVSGGMLGIVEKLAPLARSRRGGQLMTWLLGMLIFFDDYANTLLLG
ncbi:MAG: Na+/H+ antiporter NhaC family protein, partial [Planctomycetota bacterium]|nr:Na+/H+ antiporter NhaC family protein [Planctomycetota bacterium]